ncbi:glycine cleavage T C-terminal barrel domain-containing protein [Salinifilum ghardaiensis]
MDGIALTGHPGDTLASALLANDRIEVAPSIHRDRPRGILTADETEPNAMVQVLGGRPEPMVPATRVELADGLQVATLSGVGWLCPAEDEHTYDKKHVHVDVAVVGAGPAGIAAARAAGRSGARVLLVEQDTEIGGGLLDGHHGVDGRSATDWLAGVSREFVELDETRVLTRATAVGCYEGGPLLVAERRGARQRLWHVRARHVVLATGAHERPLVFADNDRPGTMLAGAVRRYLHRFGVLPGHRAVVATTSDSAYRTVFALAEAGADVRAVVDSRAHPPEELARLAEETGAVVHRGAAVVGTEGDRRVSAARIAPLDGDGHPAGPAVQHDCDLLAVSGGWDPATQLFGHAGGQLRWDPVIAAFVPQQGEDLPRVIGAARGTLDLAGCLAQGYAAGAELATASGFRTAPPPVPPVRGDRPPTRPRPLWLVPGESGEPARWCDHFVDLQRDASVADVWHALGTGVRSVEHVERATTIGTGSDQGKTSRVNAAALVAEALGARDPGEVGATTASSPYAPVPMALWAGRERGRLHDPARVTPMHPWHVARGAVFEDVDQWKRPRCYPRDGEDVDRAVQRECRAARTGVAVQDVTPLGKIEVAGPDAPEFLDRICTSGLAGLPVGEARCGVMCTPDGVVFEHGVAARLAPDRYLMSTTTGNAAHVLDWLQEWLRTEWFELAVYCTPVTEQWAAVAVVGPDSRAVVARLAPDLDVAAGAFGPLEFRWAVLRDGVPARISRVSFSGELAFEIHVETWYGRALWEAVHAAGEDHGITPYGTEAMRVLRAEKGFAIVGQDTDGTATPLDLGMDRVVSARADFVGKRSLSRADVRRCDRRQLVGLLPRDPEERLPEGAHLVEPDVPREPPVPVLGHVTSSYRSAALERTFALALVRAGRSRVGETLHVPLRGRSAPVEVAEPVLYDREGARRDGR